MRGPHAVVGGDKALRDGGRSGSGSGTGTGIGGGSGIGTRLRVHRAARDEHDEERSHAAIMTPCHLFFDVAVFFDVAAIGLFRAFVPGGGVVPSPHCFSSFFGACAR